MITFNDIGSTMQGTDLSEIMSLESGPVVAVLVVAIPSISALVYYYIMYKTEKDRNNVMTNLVNKFIETHQEEMEARWERVAEIEKAHWERVAEIEASYEEKIDALKKEMAAADTAYQEQGQAILDEFEKALETKGVTIWDMFKTVRRILFSNKSDTNKDKKELAIPANDDNNIEDLVNRLTPKELANLEKTIANMKAQGQLKPGELTKQ